MNGDTRGARSEKRKPDLLTGGAYDKSYIEGQIKDHPQVAAATNGYGG